jgi:hypothetical protein
LETTRLKTSGRAIAELSSRLIVGGAHPVASTISDAARAFSDSFSRAVSSRRISRRLRGSGSEIGSFTRIVDSRLPMSCSSPGRRMLTGTSATRYSGGSSPRPSK